MEIFTAGVDLLKNVVTVIGGGVAIIGAIQFFMGQGDSNAAEKKTGMTLFIAGGAITLIALTLIPMLGNLMTV